jgi:hypothetical protein
VEHRLQKQRLEEQDRRRSRAQQTATTPSPSADEEPAPKKIRSSVALKEPKKTFDVTSTTTALAAVGEDFQHMSAHRSQRPGVAAEEVSVSSSIDCCCACINCAHMSTGRRGGASLQKTWCRR